MNGASSEREGDPSLAGVLVLLTRAREDNEELRGPLEALGAEVVSLPCIAIAPPENPGDLVEALSNLSRYHWIAFTSRNGVRAFYEAMGTGTIPTEALIAAVGPGTQRELEIRGVRVDLHFRTASAAALAEALTETGLEGETVLLPVGEIARPELAEKLRRAGAQVDTVVAYRTVKPSSFDLAAMRQLREGQFDLVLIASPSAINNLLSELRDPAYLERPSIVAIGETTARAIRAYGLEVQSVA